MLHGVRSHSGWFGRSAASLASVGHPVYGFDRRGSGLSRETRGHMDSFWDVVSDTLAVVRRAMTVHAAERVHVLGHCFGAIPATIFACRHPDRVASLILPTPGICTNLKIGWHKGLRIGISRLIGRKRYVSLPLDPEQMADCRRCQQFIAHDPLSLECPTAGLCFEIYRARRWLSANKNRLTVPLFMAMAGRDRISDNPGNAAFFDRVPVARKKIVTYVDASHILEYSAEKDRFFADMAAWLDNGYENRP
jgi:alpha-beta hydrolase superfamily lysophospholipase